MLDVSCGLSISNYSKSDMGRFGADELCVATDVYDAANIGSFNAHTSVPAGATNRSTNDHVSLVSGVVKNVHDGSLVDLELLCHFTHGEVLFIIEADDFAVSVSELSSVLDWDALDPGRGLLLTTLLDSLHDLGRES